MMEKLRAKYTKEQIRRYMKRMLLMVIANIGYAVTLHLFLADNNIAGGGPTGYYRFGVTYDEVAGCYAHFYNNHYFRPIKF